MKSRSIKIAGSNEEDARVNGAIKLGLTPDDVSVETAGENQFTITEKDLPAEVEIFVSADKMNATISSISPPRGNGPALSDDDIKKALAESKVIVGIKQTVIEQLVAELSETPEDKKNILIAEGTPKTDGEDAKIVFKTGANAENKNREASIFVKPGQVIAEITPPTEGVNGLNVLGKEIKAQKGKPYDIKAGKNVTLSEDKSCFIADMYGVVETADKCIAIKEPLTVSNDKMTADLKICTRLSDNSPVEKDDILSLLEQVGIVHVILNDNIEAALKKDQPVQTVRVAEGTPQKEGEDARFEYFFRLSNHDPEEVDSMRKEKGIEESEIQKEIFAAGELIAEKIPPVPPEDGCTIFGKVINAKKPKDRKLIAGEGVKVTENGLQYIVDEEAMGYPNLVNGKLFIEDPFRITEDRLNVHVRLHSPSKSDRLLTDETIKKRLEWLGIKQGIDEETIQQAREMVLSKTNTVHEILIAKGKAAQNGNDARFKFLFQREKHPGMCVDKTGCIDFKERGTIQNVKKGEVIAQKIMSTSGEDGFDVFGNILNAEPGRDLNLIPIEGVKVSEDGQTYRAEKNGMVTLIGEDRIGVLKVYEIPGDVDLSSGNLDMDGSLVINGWVRAGFSVKASGDIFVAQGVENSVLTCGANLKVNRGILGKSKCILMAKGDVCADFIESARVNAGGNIWVKNSIARSMVSSKGHVDATSGKGRIMGGTVFASNGVKANEIGSETGIETIIKVGSVPKALKILTRDKKYLASLRKHSRRINHTMGGLVKKSETMALGDTERIMLQELKKLKRRTVNLESKEARYEQILKKELNENKKSIEVDVNHMVHEGTVIIINGYAFRVTDCLKGKGKFVLNLEKQAVEFI